MKIFAQFLIFSLLITQIYAQQSPTSPDFKKKESTDWISFKAAEQIPAQQLAQSKSTLKLEADDNLQLLKADNDQLGFRHYRYQQTYKGVPIEGAIYLMHEKNNQVKHANGKLAYKLNLNTISTVSETTALQSALEHMNAAQYAWQNLDHESLLKDVENRADATFYPTGELVIINPERERKAEDYRLAYKFDVYAIEPLERQLVYVDAQTGRILDTVEKIHDCTGGEATITANTSYSGTVSFDACSDGTLQSSSAGVDIKVFDSNSTNDYLEILADNSDPTAAEVFWATGQTYEYFLNTHSRNSLDDNGMPLWSWVHFGLNYNNAFWNGSWMTYGDGDNSLFSSLTAPDVVAHEMAHGITDFSADLVYRNESGALNESFSDIFGEVAENYMRGTNDWLMGGDFMVYLGKNALRDMSNPNSSAAYTQQPDTYFGDYWYLGAGDNGGVHFNSGVQNYWFYLLSEGGSGVNDNGYAYNMNGIGMAKAAAIAYRNLTVYLSPYSLHVDARAGAIQAAIDLYGAGSNEVLQTEAAWCAVGVEVTTPTACSCSDKLALMALYNATDGANWTNTWDFNEPTGDWHGVTLDEFSCVMNVYLDNNQMTGSLPPELFSLSSVEALHLNSNQLTGSIPPELGNLSDLKSLILFSNQLNSNIPPELGNLNNLTYLQLANNQLTGNIPMELGSLSNLTYLQLANNQLTGNIPTELGSLGNLTNLHLANNQLTGNIPMEISSLNNLTNLNLSSNQLSGSILSELGNLSNLTGLYLYDNQLSSNIPVELGDLSNLESLYLSDNQLTGSIPLEFGDLNNLQWLYLSNNQLNGCYDENLMNVNVSYFFGNDIGSNQTISDGNSFDAPWEDFISVGAGVCNNPYLNCRYNDSLILLALYDATNGASWTNIWDLDQPVDTWYGVTLNGFGCVTILNLANNQLEGSVPGELSNLSNLLELTLHTNQLSSTIPPELGYLSKLKRLNLAGNGLTGIIPPELGDLNDLEYLDLQNNQLSGNIPSELSGLSNLYTLYLWNNQLSGNIPPELGNLSSLYALYLSNNQLSGNIPPELGNISNLWLRVSDNQLSGCYDAALINLCNGANSNAYISNGNSFDAPWEDFCSSGTGACTPICFGDDYGALRVLYLSTDGDNWTNNTGWPTAADLLANSTAPAGTDMSTWYGVTLNANGCVAILNLTNNQLDGYIPPAIENLANLTQLYLWNNQLSGNIPPELGNLPNLVQLHLSKNQLNGYIPPELGNLSNLTSLFLYDNELGGYIPPGFGNLSNLRQLDLSKNQLSSSIPSSLGNLTDLTYLHLADNQLSGNIPVELGNLSNLTNLRLELNGLSGNIPVELGDLSNLTNLRLELNGLSGNIPPELGGLSNLIDLRLSYNDLTGSIPVELGNLSNLITLHLELNELDGTIPVELGSLSNLADLRLSFNDLTGSIPVELGNLSNLITLHLEFNELDGTIPVELGGLSNLADLRLYLNDLTGTIPSELGNLSNLEYLYLNRNELSGTIPPELGNLSSLVSLNLAGNELSGTIPSELGNLSNLVSLKIYNNDLSGCYDQNLANLCDGLGINSFISIGNNFDATWEDFCSNGAGTCSFTCLENDYNALRELYLSTNGDNWTNNTGWPTAADFNANPSPPIGTDMSSWFGISLDGNDCVTDLFLSDNQLTGSIPPELGNLSNLTWLYLSDNELTGSIPPEIGNLTNLTNVSFQNNQLSGCFDANLANLCDFSSASFFDTGNNFDVSWTDFCSSGAGTCSLTCFENDYNALRELYLSTDGDNWTNNTGWPTAADFSANPNPAIGTNIDTWYGVSANGNGCVVNLFLSDNQLTGNIPPELGNLSSLYQLHLQNNQLTGSIPATLGNVGNLLYMLLYDNQLTGNIPSELGNLNSLGWLMLQDNQLTGSIPPELGNLSVNRFFIENNQLSGCYDANLSNLCNTINPNYNVNQLTSDGNNFDVPWEDFCNSEAGTCPVAAPCLNNEYAALRTLYLSTDGDNWINNTGWPTVTDFNASPYPPTGTNMGTWFGVSLDGDGCVSGLNLTFNQLNGSIPKELVNLSNLVNLNLNNNQLAGCYDADLAALCHIVYANSSISDGNNLDAPWEDFCNSGAGTCQSFSVWPGDFNNNGIAEMTDLLYWSLAEGETGPVRPNASLSWAAQDCPDWQNQANGINRKHLDGNGNGIIDNSDLNALILNYDSTHINILPPFTSSPLEFRLELVSSIPNGDSMIYTYELHLESAVPVSAHGIACTIDFSQLSSIDNIDVNITNSSLEPDVYLDIYDPIQQTLDIGLSRTDNINQFIDGSIANFIVVNNDLPTVGTYMLNVCNGSLMSVSGLVNGAGILTAVSGSSFYGVFEDEGLTTTISTTDEQCNTLGQATLQILGGTAPYTYDWSNGATSAEVSNLTSGLYTVTVTDASGLSTVIPIQINGAIPIYDANGNSLCNNACPEFLTPANGLPNGAYRADNTVDSDATILPNNAVEFKAGQLIKLDNGFSIPPGAAFSGEIEDCSGN